MKRRAKSFDEVDVELEEALDRIRDRVERTEHGRVIAVIERQERVTTGHRVHVDGMLTRDMELIMAEKPRKGRKRGCR